MTMRAERNVPRLAMSIADLALSLGVSTNSIRKMVEEGRLPRPRVWNTRRIWRTAEIDAALSEWPIDGEEEPGAQDQWRAEA